MQDVAVYKIRKKNEYFNTVKETRLIHQIKTAFFIMRKQIILLIVYLSFFTSAVKAQQLNQEFVDGISIGTRKSVVIDIVMSQLRTYFETDTDGVLSFIRKKYKVNIKNKNKLDAFITSMQDVIRTQLQTNENWQTVDSYSKYGVGINKVLGHNMTFPGYGKSGSGKNGDGHCDLSFKNEYVSGIYGSLDITRDYSIHSGFNYDNNHLANCANVLRNNYGSFTFKQGSTTWNSCSTNPENVPIITYYFNSDDDYAATFTFTYGIFQRKVVGGYRYQCVASGNHLTNIAFSVSQK